MCRSDEDRYHKKYEKGTFFLCKKCKKSLTVGPQPQPMLFNPNVLEPVQNKYSMHPITFLITITVKYLELTNHDP